MRQGKISTRAISALLALLMALSVVIALPAVAEETVSESASTVKELYSLDFSKAGGALSAADTATWLANNNGFTLTGTNSNTIDANGFYKIVKNNHVISNGAPSDFINLLAGWYNGYHTPGKTYEITMDLRIDNLSPYTRNTSSTSNYYYEASDGTQYTTIYTDESGWSFFAARIGGNYDSLFRIGMVDGKGYLFAESAAPSANSSNFTTLGNLYVMDADKNKIYLAEDGGSFGGKDPSKFSLAYIIDPDTAYEVEKNGVYALRIVYELGKYSYSSKNGYETGVKAHLYVKGENDAEETYLGYSDWTSYTASAASGFRISDGGNIASIANIKVSVNEPATVVWSADLTKFGPNGNGTVSGIDNTTYALTNTMGLTNSNPANKPANSNLNMASGLLEGFSSTVNISAVNEYNPVFDLLTGNFVYNGQRLDTTFLEFDYMLETTFNPTHRSDTSVTVDGTTVTMYTPYAIKDGATLNFRFRSGGQTSTQMFRITENGYIYTRDHEASITTSATGVDGYIYYKDSEGTKVYFDANGYRYTLVNDKKSYVDDLSGAAPTVTGLNNLSGAMDSAYYASAFKLTEGTKYRIGVKIDVTERSAGVSYIDQTVYIKEAGANEWFKVGTSTQYWYDSTASKYDAAKQTIWLSGATGQTFGGNMVAYACTDDQHVASLTKTETILSDTGLVYTKTTCDFCGDVTFKKDGVVYTSETKSSTCDGSYVLWTAADGSGKTFITDVTKGSHSYSTSNGLCSKCDTYAYGIERRESTSLGNANGDAPVYDAATQTIKAPDGGMALTKPENPLGSSSYPFVMTLEFKLTEAIVNDTSETSSWPLLSYQASNLYEYVGVHVVDDEPTLTLGTYTDRHIKTIEYDTWYTLQVAVVPRAENNTKDGVTTTYYYSDARIYLDGEMIGEKYDFGFTSTPPAAGNVRVGVQTAYSYYRFGWEARYIGFQQSTLEDAYTLQNTNEVINIRYDRYQTGSPSHANARSVIGTTMTGLRPESTVGGKYGILVNANSYKTISLSTLLLDGTEFGLSGKKYEIGVKFAVPNTDANEDGHADALAANGQNLVRLSKYGDAIQSVLLGYRSWGQVHASGKDLVTAAGEQISVLREFDENGVPTSILDLRVVVDEKNNTYSVYADGKVAYYWNGDVLTRAINLNMPLNQNGGTGKTTYGSITKADANAAGVNSFDYQYMRLFREMSRVAVEEISVRLLPDSDITLVGTQVKSADFTESGGFDLRFVFALDDIYVNAVKFEIKAYKNGEYMGVQYASTQTVLKGIVEDHEISYACKYGEGDYLAAVRVRGIDETNSTNVYTFEITAYTTINGTDPISIAHYTVSCNGVGGDVRTVANHVSQ